MIEVYMRANRVFRGIQKWVTGLLTVSLLLQGTSSLILALLLLPSTVQASETVIDATVSTAADSATLTGSRTVFIDDDIGYVFYRDRNSQCVYSKTTDQGATWSAAVAFDTQTDCQRLSVWYDRWTPGDNTGTFIHLSTFDTGDDDVFYNRLDTTTDTLLLSTSINVSSNSGQTATLTGAANTVTITKGTSGEVFIAMSDGNDSFVVSCTTGCDQSTNWNETGSPFLDLANDPNLLIPLANGNIMIINRDLSTNDIRSAIWNGSSWSSWDTIDANAIENTTFDGGMSAAINKNDGTVYLAYTADNNNFTAADHDIRTARYDGVGWTNRTDVLTNEPGRGLHDVTIAIDENTDEVYVAYAIRDTLANAASAHIYYQVSSTTMSTWGGEVGPVSVTPGNLYGPSLNLFNNERLYITWYNHTNGTLYGDTIADIGPDTKVTALGSAVVSARASTTDVYLGGTFAIESISSRTVSAITLTEVGTINAETGLVDTKLFYEVDTTAPYDCVSESYSGTEAQFGATDPGGFSGADGTASFSGTIVGISPTETLCLYVVTTVTPAASDGDTVSITINNPPTDVTVSGATAFPLTPVSVTGATTVVSPNLTQTGYHWRLDNGSETTASSASAGSENTPLTALAVETTRRLRLQVSNEGSTSTVPSDLTLQYATAAPTCSGATGWTVVGSPGATWAMVATANLTDGADTTNIAISAGGITDANTTFLTPNGGVRDATSTVPGLVLGTSNFAEVEFAIEALNTVNEGETYCFRLVANNDPLFAYTQYAEATIAADVTVSTLGSQIAETDIPSDDVYLGGSFVLMENGLGRTVTSITLTESGTIDAETGLSTIRLYYDLDTSAPYNCSSESYASTDTLFGSGNFTGPDGTATISGTLNLPTDSAACLYIVAAVTESPQNGETITLAITSPSTDVVVSAGSVGPSTPVTLATSTTLRGGILTQTGYHWRNDDGSESAATSYTGGLENTPVANFALETPIRLRLGVSNEGATSSVATTYELQYGAKITTCADINVWTGVNDEALDDWDMQPTANLTDGGDTTNIAIATGGVTDGNTAFRTPNGGVRDTQSTTSPITLTETQFTELEFSLTSTENTTNETTYCFRVVGNGMPLLQYDQYAEVTTIPKRDFRIQRGTTIITGTDATITAGVDYTAPAATNTAFIRITNTHHTGAGRTAGGGTQNADDVTAYISNQTDITSSITFSRTAAVNNTYIDWEIIEFIGEPGTDNEMVVRGIGTAAFSNTALSFTGAAVPGVGEDERVVVFVTGAANRNTGRNYFASQVTSEWASSTNQPVFTRAATGNAPIDISYAVVEFVGLNWAVQRVEHAYTAAGVTETESITPVNSLERAFLHTQRRVGATTNVVHYGHTVWLSGLGTVSFELEAGASTAVEQTSVAWVIENLQLGQGAMTVQRLNGSTLAGAEPLALSVSLPVPVVALNNSSVFGNSRAAGGNTAYPRPIAGLTLTGLDTLQVWRSDTGSLLSYRVEVLEWPVADLAIRQNYYRFYVDNNELTPVDPWPAGPTDLGENTPVSATNDALGEGEVIRVRMSVRLANANLSAGIEAFNLQYGQQLTTCSAVTDWFDVGDTASSSIWRGFAATGTDDGTALAANPPNPGELLLSVADVGGRLVEENPSFANPYAASDGQDIEYDWFVQQNGATPSTNYCFRMVRLDAPLDGYFNFPTIRTAGFSPASQNWRWYTDAENETPTTPLAAENVAPASVTNNDTITLRVTVGETKNVTGNGAKFRLQYSEYPDFRSVVDVVGTSTCVENSLWCYAEGPVPDNTNIQNAVLSDGAGCVAGTGSGCGTHNSQPAYVAGHTHGAGLSVEYSFTLRSAAPRVNATYYFRLIDANTDIPVATAVGETYPSLVTESSTLSFTLTGLPVGTTTAGVVTTIPTTPATIDFGRLDIGVEQIGAQRVAVETNATEGFQIFKYARNQLLNSQGNQIAPLPASNAAPGSWNTLCDPLVSSCVGYHTTDATLSGTSTRFAAFDTYAGLSSDLQEIVFSSIPTSTTEDVVYRIVATELQPAGQYETDIVYIAVPVY